MTTVHIEDARLAGELNDYGRLSRAVAACNSGDTLELPPTKDDLSDMLEIGGNLLRIVGKRINIKARWTWLRGSGSSVLFYGGINTEIWNVECEMPTLYGPGWQAGTAALALRNVNDSQISYAVREAKAGVRLISAMKCTIRYCHLVERAMGDCLYGYEIGVDGSPGTCANANTIYGQMAGFGIQDDAYWAQNPTYFRDVAPSSESWKLLGISVESSRQMRLCELGPNKRLEVNPSWLEGPDASPGQIAFGPATSTVDQTGGYKFKIVEQGGLVVDRGGHR